MASGDQGSRPGWVAKARNGLDVVATIGLVVAAVAVTYSYAIKKSPSQPARLKLPSQPISLEGAGLIGSRTAQVVFIEFSDFECPFCRQFATIVLPEFRKKYIAGGRVRLAFYNLPLPNHQRARPAALGAICAAALGDFDVYHDLVFASRGALGDDNLQDFARQSGLDRDRYSRCLSTSAEATLNKQIELAKSLGLSGTPMFFVGTVEPDGRVRVTTALDGARPLSDFAAAVDQVFERE